MGDKDLGRMGESTFSKWCAETNLVANPSNVDMCGWDFFVEFKADRDYSSPSIHVAPVQCFVQVKATDGRKRQLQIKLLNLHRLAVVRQPAFIVFIEFDGCSDAQNIFLVHLDPVLIKEIIEKMYRRNIEFGEGKRKTKTKTKTKTNFNPGTMLVKYDDSHKLVSASGAAFREALIANIGGCMDDYIKNKVSCLESCGYESGGAKFTFSADKEKSLGTLINATLGISRPIDVINFRGVDSRFGVDAKEPFAEGEASEISIEGVSPTAKGFLGFRVLASEAWMEFESDLYVSPLCGWILDEFKTIRICGDFFDIFMQPHTGEVECKFSILDEAAIELVKLKRSLKLLQRLACANGAIGLRFKFGNDWNFEAEISQIKVPSLSYFNELEALEGALEVFSIFHFDEPIQVTLSEIAHNGSVIINFIKLLKTDFRNSVSEVDGLPEGADLDKDIAYVFLLAVAIGTRVFGILMVLIGRGERLQNERIKLNVDRMEVQSKMISDHGSRIENELIASEFLNAKEKYVSGYTVICGGQISPR